MDKIRKTARDMYMGWLMQRVMDSGVPKEGAVKKAADIFMADFNEFAKTLSTPTEG